MFFRSRIAIAAVAVAAAVSAVPVESQAKSAILPLTRVSNINSSIKNLIGRGQSRINAINGVHTRPHPDVITDPATNEDVFYVAPIKIGGTTWNLIVDTGSANTWCGARKPCEKTPTGKSTGGHVEVSYGSGSFSGTEYTDVVAIGSYSATQSIGAASTSSGFSGVDGILGLGPDDLTEGTVSNANTVPTYVDTLYNEGLISIKLVAISFHPEYGSDTNDTNGELTFGGVDTSKYSGVLTYLPIVKSGPAAAYWGVNVASFTYGSTTLSSAATAAIVDTGTTLIYVPTAVYNKFLAAAGGETDSSSGLAVFTKMPTQNFGFNLGSRTYTLTPAQYLIPAAQYGYFGLTTGKFYSWINSGGSSGVDTIIGQKFLEYYYSAYDSTNSRIGFATAA